MSLDEREYDQLADDFIAAEKALRRKDPRLTDPHVFRRKPTGPKIVIYLIVGLFAFLELLVMGGMRGCGRWCG